MFRGDFRAECSPCAFVIDVEVDLCSALLCGCAALLFFVCFSCLSSLLLLLPLVLRTCFTALCFLIGLALLPLGTACNMPWAISLAFPHGWPFSFAPRKMLVLWVGHQRLELASDCRERGGLGDPLCLQPDPFLGEGFGLQAAPILPCAVLLLHSAWFRPFSLQGFMGYVSLHLVVSLITCHVDLACKTHFLGPRPSVTPTVPSWWCCSQRWLGMLG